MIVLNLRNNVRVARDDPIAVLGAPVNRVIDPQLVIDRIRVAKKLSAVEIVPDHACPMAPELERL